MPQMQIGSGLQTSRCRLSSLAGNSLPRWFPALALTLLGGFGATVVRAQTPPGRSASETTAAAQPTATSATPLARFVPRDNLIFYVDFDGLDAHAEAWRKTAAYRMLNQTPLGVMLVDPANLPKAEELKALMFPATLAVVVDDTSIRLVSRESFPNVVSGLGMGAIGGALLAPAVQAARARALEAAGVPPGQAGRTDTRAGQPPRRSTTPSRQRSAGATWRSPRARANRQARWRTRDPDDLHPALSLSL